MGTELSPFNLTRSSLYLLKISRCCYQLKKMKYGGSLIETHVASDNQRTNGPVNAHLISWPSKAQNIQTMENIW